MSIDLSVTFTPIMAYMSQLYSTHSLLNYIIHLLINTIYTTAHQLQCNFWDNLAES